MQVLDSWNEVKELSETFKKLKTEKPNIKISRFSFLGALHEGHLNIAKEIKNKSDILILQFNELMCYLNLILWNTSGEYSNIYKRRDATYGFVDIYHSVYPIKEHVDYLMLNKLPDEGKLKKIHDRIYPDFLKVKDFVTLELNLSYVIAIEVMFMHLNDPIQKYITSDMTGPKNALQFLIHNKLFKHKYIKSYNPDIDKHVIWKMFTNDKGEAYTRTKKELTFIRPKAVELFENGCRDYEKFRSLIFGLTGGKLFSIIDINKVERIYEITDNCVICYGSTFSYEIIFIINGRLI